MEEVPCDEVARSVFALTALWSVRFGGGRFGGIMHRRDMRTGDLSRSRLGRGRCVGPGERQVKRPLSGALI